MIQAIESQNLFQIKAYFYFKSSIECKIQIFLIAHKTSTFSEDQRKFELNN